MSAFYCEYELKDVTAIEDSTPTTTYNQSFGTLAKVKDNVSFVDYATLEEDYFILDGSMQEFPDDPKDIVFFSNVLSGKDGTFAKNPIVNIDFSENHTSYGITFHFVGDHPLEMVITWLDLSGTQISKKVYQIDANKFFAKNQVENYRGLKIEFTKTKAYRYIKFYYLEYGMDLIFGANGMPVKDAQLIEDLDVLSDKIPINQLTYKLIDEHNDFDIGNQSGLHKVLQAGQKMIAYEEVDKSRFLLGRFYLSSSSTDQNITAMNCMDIKGVLDGRDFKEGKVYNGELAGGVIDAIMLAAGITDYIVSEEVRKIPLYGWLKIQTCRKALREVLFACGAVIDSARSTSLTIYKQKREIKTSIERSRKISTATTNKEYVSDVSIKFPVYSLSSELKEVAKGSYAKGTHTIELSSPASNMAINSGSILKQTHNYVTFIVLQNTEVVISGYKYAKEDLTVSASMEDVDAGQSRSTKKYNSTLLNASQAMETAKRILDYYSLRLNIKIKFLNVGDKVADWSEVANPQSNYGNYVAGFEKMTTALTGGFISQAELSGYYKLLTDYYYTGELLGGEDIGGL